MRHGYNTTERIYHVSWLSRVGPLIIRLTSGLSPEKISHVSVVDGVVVKIYKIRTGIKIKDLRAITRVPRTVFFKLQALNLIWVINEGSLLSTGYWRDFSLDGPLPNMKGFSTNVLSNCHQGSFSHKSLPPYRPRLARFGNLPSLDLDTSYIFHLAQQGLLF